MKITKTALICCALLLAGTLSACEISDQPQQPAGSASSAAESEDMNEQQSEPETDQQQESASSAAASESSSAAGAEQNDPAPSGGQDTQSEQSEQGGQDTQNNTSAANNSSESYEIGSEPTLSIGVIHAKAGQKSVPVSVKISNNPGFAAGGIRVIYDAGIFPKYDPETNEGVSDPGPAVGSALTYCSVAADNRIVAYGVLGSKDCDEDGAVFTCYFDIPDNAPSGKVYKLRTEIEELNDAESQRVEVKLVGGEIRID